MTPRTVTILFVLALVSVGIAVAGTASRTGFQQTNYEGEQLFPGLFEKASEVTEVMILQHGVRFDFDLKDGQWTMRQSDGYPVHGNLVSKVIFGLTNMELLEAKTAKPSRLAALNLGDSDDPKSDSQHVTLSGKDGVIADLIVGRANYFLPTTTTGGMYVRRPGEDQAWLVKGLVDIGVEPRDWLMRDIINIPVDTITNVEVRQPDGGQLIVERREGVSGDFAFANLPENMKLKSEYAPRNIAAIVSSFVLNNVRKDESVPLDPSQAYEAVYASQGGIQATLRFWQKEGTQYLRLSATYTGDDPASDAAKQVAAINARTAGWTYIIPEYQFQQVSKTWANVAEKVEPAS